MPLKQLVDVTAADLSEAVSLPVYADSLVDRAGCLFFLAGRGDDRSLGIVAPGDEGDGHGFTGAERAIQLGGRSLHLRLCSLTAANAAALRARLDWLRPVCLGLETSFGFGDRLGLATPGHIQAAREFSSVRPIFAQQSVRENARTGRTPQQVLDDATWGVFQQGWRAPWGADADHLKTTEAMDAFVEAGFTLYTIDPGDHVDNAAHTAPLDEVATKVEALDWSALESTRQDMERRYLDRSFDLGDVSLTFDRETLFRASAKYGRAVAHTARMYRHLVERMRSTPFELEVSVDETETPTSPVEHLYIAGELKRLGVEWVSLAPRYIGRFEKGVDYVGDLDVFEAHLAHHAAIAAHFGPYKLSIHSGSDKFSIYPIIARLTEGLVHVKTAGTSYLEAVRAVARVDVDFFRQILALARQRYQTDRATYHVSGDLDAVPAPDELADGELPDLLDQFDARQVLHVTFGSVLDAFGDRLQETLVAHEAVYRELLLAHFARHLNPFATWREGEDA